MKKFLFGAFKLVGTAVVVAGTTILFRELYDEWKYGRMKRRYEEENNEKETA